ncbi:PDZ domain-containing protein [Prescottella agglutinans]|uniref:PDZ domain-containing protein n=1 Tax=Prescottella agglutinans TaxID=1644129 RepID=A0A3S3ATX0_9NOCA|nr:trypsin-like peptidase domain-containing protein [Prescottella agglutinans]RVW08362.1 PDZ domain-containing protein [Prescottella agglutinans]
MSARGIRRASAAIAALAAAGLAFLSIPLQTGTLGAPAPTTVAVAPAAPPPPAVALAPEELSNRVVPTIVTLTARSGLGTTAGTGIVLGARDPRGSDAIVLTNHHVVDGGLEIAATSMRDRSAYAVEVVGYDSARDLAVLRLPGAADLPPARLASSESVRIGDPVTAIGNAEGGGVPVSAPGAVTRVGVTVMTRNSVDGSRNELSGLIEVDANVRPGDSGGPLVNAFGDVVGVNSAGNAVAPGAGPEPAPKPTSYAIPIDAAMDLVEQVLSGRASDTVHIGPTPLLGVSVRDHRDQQTGSRSGAEVTVVAYRSPAEGVGLARGDVIVEFDGVPILSSTDLNLRMVALHPGDSVRLRWIDATGAERSGSLVLTEGPPR